MATASAGASALFTCGGRSISGQWSIRCIRCIIGPSRWVCRICQLLSGGAAAHKNGEKGSGRIRQRDSDVSQGMVRFSSDGLALALDWVPAVHQFKLGSAEQLEHGIRETLRERQTVSQLVDAMQWIDRMNLVSARSRTKCVASQKCWA